ncbi:hypothetical protein HYV85_03455 [Candidatus Woesearchaeota archaeon]|nr:hypothetical protein [Candidatus Woesearchaeota archaeon]
MRLPTAGSEGLVKIVEGFVSNYNASGNFSGLRVIADILYHTAMEHRQTGNISRAGVCDWLEAAKSAYAAALETYGMQQEQVPGFAEQIVASIAEIDRMIGYSSPYGTQLTPKEGDSIGSEFQLMPQPLPEQRRLRVAVMER